MMTMLFVLLSANLNAAQKDAAGCKDHPLIPRMQDYYITGCSDAAASFDADILNGKNSETVHIEGNSMALLYSPQPDLKSKPGELQLRRNFEDAVKKTGWRTCRRNARPKMADLQDSQKGQGVLGCADG